MKKLGKALGAVAIVGAVAAGGAAFTNSNTLPSNNTAGYAQVSVSGVVATSVTYTLNAVGTEVTDVNLTLTGDTTSDVIKLGFNGAATFDCSDTGTAGASSTTYDCDVASLHQTVTGLTQLAVVAVNS